MEENGKTLFEQDDKLDSVRVILWSGTIDEYGKKAIAENLIISLDRETFEQIDWDGLKEKMIFDTLDVSIFEEAYIRGS